MHISEAITRLQAKIADFGLEGWTARSNNRKSDAGLCSFNARTIYLSKEVVPVLSDYEVEQTILHEIAHALAGPGAGHGPGWMRIARSIGYHGDTKKKITIEQAIKIFLWSGKCPNCLDVVATVNRIPTRPASCPGCSKGVYSEAYRLVWTNRKTGASVT